MGGTAFFAGRSNGETGEKRRTTTLTTSTTATTRRLPGRLRRLADAALARALGHPRARNRYAVDLGVRIPMRDGVELVGDHYVPLTPKPRGTVLIRTPYGRGFPEAAVHGRTFAARGYHVLVQSVRGTFGSGGSFRAMAQETDDGQDTVSWLRDRSWFDGRLATLGGSYLGWVQWTLLQDPPPELRASIVSVGPHDFREAVFGTGSFTLGDFLGWADQIARQEDGGMLRRLAGGAAARRRLEPALTGLPLADAAEPALEGRAPWYRQWLEHAEDDAFWRPYRAGDALRAVDVPVLLIGGWQDLFLDQTLEQYRVLRERGVDVALTVGPWTHFGVSVRGAGPNGRDSLAWLDEHVAGIGRRGRAAVRVFRTGEGTWHDLAAWPPASTEKAFGLRAGGRLTADGAVPDGAVATFTYDPADPTPSVGGRVMTGAMGVRDNRALESRPDVLTFTTDPLPADIDVIGSPVVELAMAVDNPHADVFVRLCDVDARGRSHNFSDLLRRLDPAVSAGAVQGLHLTLDQCFHRLVRGHRLRLQVSGGAFPRFARNLGTDGTMAGGSALAPSVHTVHYAQSRLTLPVAPPG
jgi:putative CocE/NonD family hydrolase